MDRKTPERVGRSGMILSVDCLNQLIDSCVCVCFAFVGHIIKLGTVLKGIGIDVVNAVVYRNIGEICAAAERFL